ncbi:hypothetical protein, partial [Heyndrickxia coagulans]|uniref:hypothetical protein n=1 Tax=Heyndrickxia coagulans TaxID=1398 RepID=UPI001C6623C9
KDISIAARIPFVLLNSQKRHFEHYPSRFWPFEAPKGHFDHQPGHFCLFEASKRTFRSLPRPLLSF